MLKTCLGLLAAVILTGHAMAQTVAEAPVELMPDHIVRRITGEPYEQIADRLVASGQVRQGVFDAAKRWDPGSVLTVCFFGGGPDLRRKIAVVASEWHEAGVAIQLDFGDPANPRRCSRQFAEIRVGFSQKGYWSFVGQDSINYAPQSEQSLNLALFDVRPVSDGEFRRVVLHEFGHALGFQHEHQHPVAGCRFNWPVVYQRLSGSPNFWSQETIDQNMRGLPYHDGLISTAFDPQSVMLYAFEPDFYEGATGNPCYHAINRDLSLGDRRMLRVAYSTLPGPVHVAAGLGGTSSGSGLPAAAPASLPARTAETLSPRQGRALIDAAAARLPLAEREVIRARLEVLASDPAFKAGRIGPRRAQYTDVDVFVCKLDARNQALAREAVTALATQPELGHLQTRDIAYPPGDAIQPGVNVVADMSHPEFAEADRLLRALSAAIPGPGRVVPNSGKGSPWLLSVTVCG